ncbi:RapZ C-terminal domain-containing protein [Streptomyces sp. 8L]|uniref:RapZ C-terminal domain-containing protein n=1 Tax=Streptomyces sp. 8L TaxID=2877242 RepID=UPI001CD51DCE|nr:RNase adapter RapZ [Streptomyces sp. 8L]MCA1221622.1 hypothetical protein [Streptomyces sp. 8L]
MEDVRDRLRDPAAARDILDLNGLHPRVQDVLNTPDARELLANLADYADMPAGPSHIAIGCAGGKHRACALTELLARALRDRGRDVEHLHARLPRVIKTDHRLVHRQRKPGSACCLRTLTHTIKARIPANVQGCGPFCVLRVRGHQPESSPACRS